MRKMGRKFRLWDAFETKRAAIRIAKDMRRQGSRMRVRRISRAGRLKWGVFTNDPRLV
jgi:hypothetical protein